MKHTLTSALSIAAAVALGTPVLAGGVTIVPQEPPPVYAPVIVDTDWTGGYIGAAFGNYRLKTSTPLGSISDSDNGFGLFAGYNHDMGQYVLGAELSYDRVTDQGADFDLARLKGRVGYDAGRWMPYMTLGFAHAKTSGGGFSASDNGYTFGLGVDFMMTPNFILGLELGRVKFDDFDNLGFDVTGDIVQLRASWKF